jgi:hypothetical protein
MIGSLYPVTKADRFESFRNFVPKAVGGKASTFQALRLKDINSRKGGGGQSGGLPTGFFWVSKELG